MKALSEILKQIPNPEIFGNREMKVNGIVMDSRKVFRGCCFIAVPGIVTDGHAFISQAIDDGASVIVCEKLPGEIHDDVTYVKVAESSSASGLIASAFYNHPSGDLHLIGVTGTNGKTTIATLLYETFTKLGFRCGLISTIKYITGKNEFPASHTTPDAVTLHQLIHEMVDSGCDYCFMEVSSHAIVQKRISGLTFTGGIFTNITHDHLDYHPTFEDYLRAKQSFFTSLPKSSFAITSKDDRNGNVMVQNSRARVYTYSTSTMADFHAKVIENTIDGLQIELGGKRVWLRMTGAFNARNVAAIFATTIVLGFDDDEVLEVLSGLEPVEGRFQQFRAPSGVTAIVDYAHTPDALKNVLDTIREVNREEGRIITVVGTGGNRDPFKRPLMAKIAADLSDKIILTSDNPRFEEPGKIVDEMKEGLNSLQLRKTIAITDRREAINTAVMMAEDQDIILIAGKGHEKYQEIEGVRHPFDDMEVVKEFMENNQQNK